MKHIELNLLTDRLRISLLLLALLCCGATGVLQAQLLVDDFNRANSNTVGNGWTETENGASGIQVSSNMLRGAAVSAGTYVPIPPQPSMHRARAPGAICTFRKLFELRFPELTDCLRALGALSATPAEGSG